MTRLHPGLVLNTRAPDTCIARHQLRRSTGFRSGLLAGWLAGWPYVGINQLRGVEEARLRHDSEVLD